MKQWIKKWSPLWRPMAVRNGSVYAACACYYIVLSLIPTALLLFSLLSIPPDMNAYNEAINRLLPEYLAAVVRPLDRIRSQKTVGLLSASGVIAVWSASKSVLTVRNGLNVMMEQQPKGSYLRKRLQAMLLLLMMFLLFISILSVTLLGEKLMYWLTQIGIHVPYWLHKALQYRYLYSFLILSLAMGGVYRLLPEQRIRMKFCLLAGSLASFGCLLFSGAFSIYVNRISSYEQLYDVLGVTVLGMIWIRVCISVVLYTGRLVFLLQCRNYQPVHILRSIFFPD